ncbi:MAG: radical SAM protein [Candidatus Altiarchaeota archaeon]|nr:radical SAM protein [Candidatus Altiarchaeota archaeon]
MAYKHLFGPVPSRRLGVSLGIDLVPYKTCTLNCVYCECGRTTNLTLERKEYVPTAEILAELGDYLKPGPDLDYITFSGSGEPTLHTGVKHIIRFLKMEYPKYKVAVLTNGTLLYDKGVREELMRADLVMPSLDAVSKEAFTRVNRPHRDIPLGDMMGGLIEFRDEFKGQIWLEIFIVPGLNDGESELRLLKKTVGRIRPDKVQINTLDRPGTESWVMPAGKAELERIASLLGGEVIASFESRKKIKSFSRNIEEDIVSTLGRRPCTAKDLSAILSLHLNEVNKYLQLLLETGRIYSEEEERGVFFRIN